MKLLKCKLCQAIIPEPPIIIGEPPSVRQAKTIQSMMQHLNELGTKEMQNQLLRRKPHAQAMSFVIANSTTISNYLMAASFDLPEELEATREMGRHSIHEATRKVRMTDCDLLQIEDEIISELEEPGDPANRIAVHNAIANLRDRYEEIGQYAPAAPAAPQTEEVTQ
jgi:hypothetical protein